MPIVSEFKRNKFCGSIASRKVYIYKETQAHVFSCEFNF